MINNKDFFSLFGFSADFDIDQDELHRRYRDLQRRVHPDKYVSSTSAERLASVQQAADVNEAFHTLKSPLRRAGYLLALRGIVPEEDKPTSLDMDFIQEQIELREDLEDIRRHHGSITKADGLLSGINARLDALFQAFARDLLDINPQMHQELHLTYHKLQFFTRLQQEAKDLVDDLEEL